MSVDPTKVQEGEVVPATPLEEAFAKINVMAEAVGKYGQTVADMQKKLEDLEKDQEKLNENQQKLVDHVNGWIGSIEGIDQTAFMAIYLYINKNLEGGMTKDKVKSTHEFIQEAFKSLEAYRDEIMKEVEENKKKLEKNAKAKARRAANKVSKKNKGNQSGSSKNTAKKGK